MANQIVITSGAKVRGLNGVLTGTSGIVSSVPLGAANGVATLDSGGKVPVSQLPSSVVTYLGTWNANTNTPTLVNGTGDAGDMYICNVAGTVNFGAGPVTFAVGDWVLYGSGTWQKSNGQNGTVTSVAVTESGDSLNITGSPITTSGTINIGFNGTNLQYVNGAGNLTTFPTLITSIGLTMPSAFSVANSPLTANGTIAVTGAGVASQYIRGDGTLANFPTSGGGGSSVAYYFNSSVSQGTLGGVAYRELSKVPIIGAGTDITIATNGYIANYITDAGDPSLLEIPAGNWNFEMFFSASSNGGSPSFYVELYKYDGTTFTLISSSSATPEGITNGTAIDLYTTALAVPLTTLTLTDRLAIRVYVNNSGRTITLHTENSHLCEVITTFSTGIAALNGLTAQVQYFQTGTSGTDFNISSTTATHTFNIPDASATARGLITTGTQTIGGTKTFTDATKNNGGIFLQNASSSSLAGYMNIGGLTNGVKFTSGGGVSNSFTLPSATGYTFTFPNATGTIALTSDISYPVTSVFGRTGAVVATEGDYSLTQLSDVTITSPTTNQVLKYNGTAWINDTDANTGTVTSVGLSAPTGFSVTGSPVTSSGTLALAFASGYSLPTTIKQSNWDDAYTFVAAFPTQTGNSGKYLTTDGSVLSWATNPLGTVTSVAMTVPTGLSVSGSPITTSGTLAVSLASGYSIPTTSSQATWDTAYSLRITTASLPLVLIGNLISMNQATALQNGFLTYTDFTTFNNKQNALTLTTTGTSGAATLVGATLNIPQYTDAYTGTVTSVAALTIGTSGTDLSSSVANSTTTPVITLNVPTASATNRGVLASADWTTFNNKQGTITLTTTGTSGAATFSANTLNIPNYGSALSGYLPLTGGTLTGPLGGTSATFSGLITGQAGIYQTNASLSIASNKFETYNGGATDMNFSYPASGSVTFTNGTIRLNIDASGNTAIGYTTNPSLYKLDVNGTGRFSGTTRVVNAEFYLSSGNAITFDGAASGNNPYIYYNSGGNQMYIRNNITNGLISIGNQNGTLTFASTGAATFSSTYGNVLFKGTNASTMWTEYYYNTSTLLGYIGGGSGILSGANASDFIVRSEADFVVATGNNRRLTIASTGAATFEGQVGVKNANTAGYNFGVGSSSGNGMMVYNGSTGNSYVFNVLNDTTNGSIVSLYGSDRTTAKIVLKGDGTGVFNSTITATGFFESSDSRLKTLIQDNYQTKGIASITPKLYTKNGKVELGYYAQDFVGILDSAVSKGSDDMLSLSYREVHTAKIYALEQEIKELKAKMN